MPRSDQGVSRNLYTLIPRTLIFLTCGETVLLLKGAANKRLWANRYNGIGGHVERGEDVLSAARRELAEETGLEIPDLWLCGTITIDTGEDTGVSIFVFRGESSTSETTTSPEGFLEWVPFDQLRNLQLVEDLPILLDKVLAKQTTDPPFAAHYAYDQDDELVITFGE